VTSPPAGSRARGASCSATSSDSHGAPHLFFFPQAPPWWNAGAGTIPWRCPAPPNPISPLSASAFPTRPWRSCLRLTTLLRGAPPQHRVLAELIPLATISRFGRRPCPMPLPIPWSSNIAISLLLPGTTSPSLVSSLPCRLWLPSSSSPASLVHAPAVIFPRRACPLAILCLAARSRVSSSSQLAHPLFGDMRSSCMSQIITAASSSAGVVLQQRPWIPSAPRPRCARRKVTASSSSDALRCVALARWGHPSSICAVPVAMPSTHGETPLSRAFRVRLNDRANKSYNKLCCARSPCCHASRIPCSTKTPSRGQHADMRDTSRPGCSH
jgi:hypothetical protein